MKFRITAFVLFMIIFFCAPIFAFDWVSLHEAANNLTLADVQRLQYENAQTIDAFYVLGLVYLSGYKDAEAQTMFLKILDKDPENIGAKWGISEVNRRNYNLDQAIEMFEALIIQAPDFSPSYVSLAYIKFNFKEYREAIILAKDVIRQGLENVDRINYVRAYLILAGANGMLAQNGGPLAKVAHGIGVFSTLKKAQKIQPEFSGVSFGLGAFYLLAPGFAGGDIEKAHAYLEQAIKLDPGMVDAYVRLAQVYQVKGDIPKFKQYLNIALEKDSKNMLANEVREENIEILKIN